MSTERNGIDTECGLIEKDHGWITPGQGGGASGINPGQGSGGSGSPIYNPWL